MKLRTRKRLLNLASASLLTVAVLLVVTAFTNSPPEVELKTTLRQSQTPKVAKTVEQTVSVDPKHTSWGRLLRRPLYDPPPPPKILVKKKKRPVTVKLTGTILEAENSQAFLRLANGTVELKRIGDQVTKDPRDGLIEKITATSITIRREEDEIQLNVENTN